MVPQSYREAIMLTTDFTDITAMLDPNDPVLAATLVDELIDDLRRGGAPVYYPASILPFEYGVSQTGLEPVQHRDRVFQHNGEMALVSVAQGAVVRVPKTVTPVFVANISWCSLVVGETDEEYIAAHIDFSRRCQYIEALSLLGAPRWAVVSVGPGQEAQNIAEKALIRRTMDGMDLDWYYERITAETDYRRDGFKTLAFHGTTQTVAVALIVPHRMMAAPVYEYSGLKRGACQRFPMMAAS